LTENAPGTPPESTAMLPNPNRFAVLHEFATGLLDRLERHFEVHAEEGFGLDLELESACVLARSAARLSPTERGSAAW
jgi:hypothetical protein